MNLPDVYRGPDSQQVIDVHAVPVAPASDRLDIRSIVATFRRRFWLFAIVAAIIFGAAAVITFNQTPTYTASARVMLDISQDEIAPMTNSLPTKGIGGSDSAINTEVEVIGSRALAGQVVEQLGLRNDPRFNAALAPPTKPGLLGRAKAAVKGVFSHSTPEDARQRAISPQTSNDELIDRVLSGLSTQRVGLSYTIDLFYNAADPEEAARIANAFATLYTQYKLEQDIGENQQAVGMLSSRIEALRQQAETDTAAVQRYRIANNLLSTDALGLTEQEISAYNQQVAMARASAAEDLARLNTAKDQLRNGSAGDDVGEALSSPVVGSLRQQRSVVSAQLADLQGRYGPRHPEILTTQRQLNDIDRAIQAEINRVISNLDAKARVSRERLQSIQGSLGNARQALRQNNQAMVQLDELTRKAATSQSLYESYLARLGQTSAQEGTIRPQSRVISNARPPLAPSSPNIPLNLALGLVLGLGAGLIVAFVAEMMSTGLTTAEDVEQRLGRPYLGSIPIVGSVDGAGNSPQDSIVTYPRSAYAEAFRSLRTSLQFSGNTPAQVVVVTSALPQEGKTNASIGLARSAALHGHRVLIIDADLRRRGLNRLLRTTKIQVGLLELLAGETSLADALLKDDATGAMILPVGKSTLDTADLLTGAAMDKLLVQLRDSYDLIVIDSPPILPIAEARSLATKADAVVFVVRWRKTAEQAIRTAFRLLPREQVNIAGVVLSRVDMRKQSRYGYGDAGYYYKQYKNYYA